MPDDAKTLFRTGQISAKAYARLGTKSGVPTKMANFDEKTKDEGRGKNRGHSGVASPRHIDQNQKVAPSGGRGVGKPSRGGSAGGGTQPKGQHLDYAAFQKPDFAAGAKVKRSNRKLGTPKSQRAPIPAQGGQYGGGGRATQ